MTGCEAKARTRKARLTPKPPLVDPYRDIRSYLRLATGDETFTFDQVILK
jgi:hypothetical protein